MISPTDIRRARGMEICEIHPVILGGDPEALENKIMLARNHHIEYVRHWNRVLRDLRDKDESQRGP